jgi:hypothetical protein
MKILLSFLCIFFLNIPVYSQLKKMPISKVTNQQIKGSRCLDSLWNISNTCPLGQERFKVNFYITLIDKVKKTIRLIGRVQSTDNIESTGLSGVEIFKSIAVANKLTNRTRLGETTDGKKFINNDGFFDITLEVEKKESIFFYGYRYFLEEFAVSKLMQ